MSSEIDMHINFCLLAYVKEGGLLGLGMWAVGFLITFFILTYSDSTLLTYMSSDIVHP